MPAEPTFKSSRLTRATSSSTAPPDVQHEVGRWLAAEGLYRQVAPAAGSRSRRATSGRKRRSRSSTQSWQLRNLAAKDFESRLVEDLGREPANLARFGRRRGDVPLSADGAGTDQHRRRSPHQYGDRRAPPSSAASWQRLMSDSRFASQVADERTAIVPLVKADPSTIRRAVSLLRSSFPRPTRTASSTSASSSRCSSRPKRPVRGPAAHAGRRSLPAPPPRQSGRRNAAQAVAAGGAPSIGLDGSHRPDQQRADRNSRRRDRRSRPQAKTSIACCKSSSRSSSKACSSSRRSKSTT